MPVDTLNFSIPQEYIPIVAPEPVLNNASRIQETNRKPDVYCFIGRSGRIYTPDGSLVRNSIRQNTDTDILELTAFDQMAVEASGEEKNILWISPPKIGVYPVTKIIITRVLNQGDYNLLVNKAVLLDIDSAQTLKMSQELSKGALNAPRLNSLDDVRSNPIILSPRQKHWLTLLEQLSPDPQWEMIRTGQDLELQKEAIAKAKSVYEGETRVEEHIGERSESCPTSGGAFETFSGGSRSKEDCSKIACRKCPWVASESDVKRIQAGVLKCCPDCGWRP